MFKSIRWRLKETWRMYTSTLNKQPIFIFGNQKSGTSAITGLLGECTGKSYTIDIFCYQGDLETQLINTTISFDQYLKKSAYYFSKDIIKEPTLTFFYPELREKFPDAQFIFIVRNPFENIRSILNRLKLPGHLESLSNEQLDSVKAINQDWFHAIDGRVFGHNGRDYIETLALRYNKMASIYEKNSKEFILVKYEDFLVEKQNYIENLAEELGLQVKKDIGRMVDYNFQPRGEKVRPEVFFQEENLDKIRRVCQYYLTYFEYK